MMHIRATNTNSTSFAFLFYTITVTNWFCDIIDRYVGEFVYYFHYYNRGDLIVVVTHVRVAYGVGVSSIDFRWREKIKGVTAGP